MEKGKKFGKNFSIFFGEAIQAGRAVSNDLPLTIGIVVTGDDVVKDWTKSGASVLRMAVPLKNESPVLGADDMLAARGSVAKNYAEGLELFRQGVYEYGDISSQVRDFENNLTATTYDICERVNTRIIGQTLGESIGSITVVVKSNSDVADTYKVQESVGAYIRGFLSKEGYGTPTEASFA